MVINIEDYKCQIFEMAEFYIALPKIVNLESDKYAAQIAKQSALKIMAIIDKNGNNISRKIVCQLESCIMSLIRGVEQFEDEEIQKNIRSIVD